ncbi:MAG: tRNA (guanosine(46)-N7)-methyltransferase TrmB, partial [Ignavibacteria bacterium]|nr:tRNA (guanosine(46)-N7)-methyltransferase TrmB [Ignavibacteria bacterium]
MGKNKLKHFSALLDFPNVFQKEKSFKGKWKSAVFKNNFPVTLELACGKGEYAVGMAELNKDGNFIGCDIKGARIYTGAK